MISFSLVVNKEIKKKDLAKIESYFNINFSKTSSRSFNAINYEDQYTINYSHSNIHITVFSDLENKVKKVLLKVKEFINNNYSNQSIGLKIHQDGLLLHKYFFDNQSLNAKIISI